jgi:hypothetical protein
MTFQLLYSSKLIKFSTLCPDLILLSENPKCLATTPIQLFWLRNNGLCFVARQQTIHEHGSKQEEK